MNAIVGDFRILKALERRGFITCDGSPRQTTRHWTGRQVRVINCHEGPKLENWYQPFTYKGVEYRLQYFDGCFAPFVVRRGVPTPQFV